jgi:hypothetical protein
MQPTPPPTVEQLLDEFAARIARRDLPPAANRFEPAQVLRRLVEALVPLLPGRNRAGRTGPARMLYQFMAHEDQTAAELARAAGLARLAGSRSHADLVRAGLLRWAYEGPRRVYRLSRWGEDWLLAIGRCEVPSARPVG